MQGPRNSTASPRPRRLRLGGLGCVAVLLATALPALPPAHRVPLAERLIASAFPSADPGYLPLVGTPPLRFGAVTPAPASIRPPPIALYTPVAPAPATNSIAASDPASTPTVPTESPVPEATEVKPSQVRPEDLLPYFQLNDGSPVESLRFTPAQPASRADFRQR